MRVTFAWNWKGGMDCWGRERDYSLFEGAVCLLGSVCDTSTSVVPLGRSTTSSLVVEFLKWRGRFGIPC